jgi:hypothetical protein
MGPARYGAAGAMAYLRHACYAGTLEYLPADASSSAAASDGGAMPSAGTPSSAAGGGLGGGGVGGAGDGRGDAGAMSPPGSSGGGGDDDSAAARQKLLRRRRAPGDSPSREPPPPAPAPGRAGAPGRSTSLPASALPGGGISDGEEDGLCDGFTDGHSDAPPSSSETASLVGSRVSYASSAGGTDCASPPDVAPAAASASGGGGGDEGPETLLRGSLERSSSHPPRPGVKRALMPPSGASSFASSFSASLGVGAASGGSSAAGGGGGNGSSLSPPRARVHPHPHAPSPAGAGWRTIPGPFHVVAAAVISCRNDAAPHGIAPRAALADGAADLIAVRACSRPSYLHHLLRLSRPKELGDHLEMPFVTAVKARAVRFTPAPAAVSAASRWNVDGELLPTGANAMTATVAAGLLTMLAFTPDDVK